MGFGTDEPLLMLIFACTTVNQDFKEVSWREAKFSRPPFNKGDVERSCIHPISVTQWHGLPLPAHCLLLLFPVAWHLSPITTWLTHTVLFWGLSYTHSCSVFCHTTQHSCHSPPSPVVILLATPFCWKPILHSPPTCCANTFSHSLVVTCPSDQVTLLDHTPS